MGGTITVPFIVKIFIAVVSLSGEENLSLRVIPMEASMPSVGSILGN